MVGCAASKLRCLKLTVASLLIRDPGSGRSTERHAESQSVPAPYDSNSNGLGVEGMLGAGEELVGDSDVGVKGSGVERQRRRSHCGEASYGKVSQCDIVVASALTRDQGVGWRVDGQAEPCICDAPQERH